LSCDARFFLVFILHAACCVIDASGSALALGGRFQAEGAELMLKLDDGRSLRRQDLIGLKLVLPQGGEIRIDGVEEEPNARGGPLPLYRLSVHAPSAPDAGDLCQPDAGGRRAALAMPDGSGGFSFTCTSGAEAKCVLMGYRPWDATQTLPLRDLHRACMRMLRADYGGDDHPTTRNGTLIDIYDRFEIQKAEMVGEMAFEAAWGPDGAVCVAHPRIAENVSLEELAKRYPHLVGRLGPQDCTDEAMRAYPQALLFNRSRATTLSAD
jgi:ADYC domain